MSEPRPRTGFAYLDEPGSGEVLAFAHRGGSFHPEIEGLENTMRAFEHAAALGYRYLETDVHLTRDGVLLAFHDAVLDRVTDREGEIAQLTLEEIRAARVGGTEQVPTLVELLDRFPDVRFNIDLKSTAAVGPLADIIVERDLADRVLIGSFSWRRLGAFRRRTAGRVPTSAAPLEVVVFLLSPSGRLARLLTRGRVAALQVPRRSGLIPILTPSFVRRAHRAGAHVHVWTVDDPAEMRELVDLGVDGLMTDRTDLLRHELEACGVWESA